MAAQQAFRTKDVETFWFLNVPQGHRQALIECFAGARCMFPSITTSVDQLNARLFAAPSPIVLVWKPQNDLFELLRQVADQYPVGVIDISPVRLRSPQSNLELGYYIAPFSPIGTSSPASVLSNAQVALAEMDPDLMAQGEALLEQWRRGQASLDAYGTSDVADPECFKLAQKNAEKILLVGAQDDKISIQRNLDNLLASCENLRARKPNAYISVISNCFVSMKGIATIDQSLIRLADHVTYAPFRPAFATNADLVSTKCPYVALGSFLRGQAVSMQTGTCFGLDLDAMTGRQAAVMAALDNALVFQRPLKGKRVAFSEIITFLDDITSNDVADKRFCVSDISRNIYKVEALQKGDDFEGVIALLKDMVAARPDDGDLWRRLGDALGDQEELEAAIDAYGRAIEVDPTLAIAHVNRTQARIRKGEMSADVGGGFRDAFRVSGGTDVEALERLFEFEWERAPVNEAILKEYQTKANILIRSLPEKRKVGKSFFSRLAAMQFEAGLLRPAQGNLKQAVARGESPQAYAKLHKYMGPAAGLKAIPVGRERCLHHVTENKNMFTDLLDAANGDIVIVGNGPQELGRRRGAEIDSHEMVVRFNTLNNSFPLSNDYGTKTDLWVRMPPTGYVKTEPEDACRHIMVTGSNRANRSSGIWDWLENLMMSGKEVGFVPKGQFYDLIGKIGKIPTAGLAIAYMLYCETGPVDPARIFGCSFTDDTDSPNDRYHSSDSAASMGNRHNFDVERDFFQTIRKESDATYYLPNARRKHQKDIPTLSISSAPVAKPLWTHEGLKGQFDRVISVSPGIVGYEIFGCPVEVAPRKEVTALIGAPRGDLRLNPQKYPTLSGNTPRHRMLILGFGLGPTGQLGQTLSEHIGAPYHAVEYGLISSCHLPSEKQFNFSLMLDDIGAFFDTEHRSRLEMLLDDGFGTQTTELTERARSLMDTILAHDITKYNNAPPMVLAPVQEKKRRILVVDQTSGDLSIKYGQCETYSFQDMLEHAMDQPNAEVLFKPHPETLAGAKGANFDIAALRNRDGLTVLEENCNILSLMSQVDEVYVMVSGVGFEALMAGKTVRCFGVPFYAGRGLTVDMVKPSRPRRPLSIEELVAGVFLQYHQFFDIDTKKPTTPEACLEQLIKRLPKNRGYAHNGKIAIDVDLGDSVEAEAFSALRAGQQPLDIQIAGEVTSLGDTIADVPGGVGLLTQKMADLGLFRVHAISENSSTIKSLEAVDNAAIVAVRKLRTPPKRTAEDEPDAVLKRTDRLDGLLEGEPISLLRIAPSERAIDILETAEGLFETSAPATVMCRLTAREFGRASAFLSKWYDAPTRARLNGIGVAVETPAPQDATMDDREITELYVFRRKDG